MTAYKDGKLHVAGHLVTDFLEDMARQGHGGLKGDRKPGDWKRLDPTEFREAYVSALYRHLWDAIREPGSIDPETSASHWAAVAFNAQILWWFDKETARGLSAEELAFHMSGQFDLDLDTCRDFIAAMGLGPAAAIYAPEK